jgi:hypothetical protein
MGRFLVIVVALAACSEKKKSEGLPPAQEWGADPGQLQPAAGSPHGGANPHGGADPNNPHAGVDMSGGGGDEPDMTGGPHTAVDMSNPHNGVDMNGGGGGGPAVPPLPPPDPNRPIDPTHHVRGKIVVHPKAKDRTSAGTAVFLIVKKDEGGKASGPPLAVEKLSWAPDGIPFELTEAQAMIAGTQLAGDVIVTAHYDLDGDALSKQPGDIIGEAHVKVPADNVTLTLDQVLP